MENIKETVKMTHTLGLGSDSDSEIEICPVCRKPLQTKVEILGVVRIVPVMCECKKREYEEEEKRREVEQQRLRLERLRSYSLMDEKFRECTFENFLVDGENEKYYKLALNYCRRWHEMKEKNIGLLLWGAPGTGKTYLAFCIANKLIEQFVPVIAISSISFLNMLKQYFNSYGQESEAEIIAMFRNASLLILDDLGAENETGWAKEKLYELIDFRYRDKKPLIVTTNLTPEQLKIKMTQQDKVPRTYDRLIEMCYPVEIKGKSRRIEKAKEKENIIKSLFED